MFNRHLYANSNLDHCIIYEQELITALVTKNIFPSQKKKTQHTKNSISICTVVAPTNHDRMMWIVNDANLSVQYLWFPGGTANVLRQLPQCTALLQFITWKIERRQHLVNATFVRLQTQYHRLLFVLFQESSNSSCNTNISIYIQRVVCQDNFRAQRIKLKNTIVYDM